MRYRFVGEKGETREARKLFATGMISFVCAFFLQTIPTFADYAFLLDFFGCLTFGGGIVLWDIRKLKFSFLFFVLAFLARLVVVLVHPVGLFAFLWGLPFSLFTLSGEITLLLQLRLSWEGKISDAAQKKLKRATNALARAELSFWTATLISYVSDLLVMPAVLMFLFAMGVRIWVSYLLFQCAPQGSRRAFAKSSVRSQ